MSIEEIEDKQARVITRRRFVQGMAAGAALAACGWKDEHASNETVPPDSAVLAGTHFDLKIDSVSVNYTGRPSRATAVNGSTPGPVLRWREGETVTISLINRLKHATSIHWHGVKGGVKVDQWGGAKGSQ